jgi:hypothetical protein
VLVTARVWVLDVAHDVNILEVLPITSSVAPQDYHALTRVFSWSP